MKSCRFSDLRGALLRGPAGNVNFIDTRDRSSISHVVMDTPWRIPSDPMAPRRKSVHRLPATIAARCEIRPDSADKKFEPAEGHFATQGGEGAIRIAAETAARMKRACNGCRCTGRGRAALEPGDPSDITRRRSRHEKAAALDFFGRCNTRHRDKHCCAVPRDDDYCGYAGIPSCRRSDT